MSSTVAPKPHPIPWQVQAMRLGFHSLGPLLPGLAGRVALRLFSTPQRRLIAERDQAVMASAQTVTIPHGGLNLIGYMWGQGPTILLMHGWESSASYLAGFVKPLVERGFRVVAFDAPAHGTSPGRQTNLVDFSQAEQAVVARFGPVHGVIGHSFGGASTVTMLELNPTLSLTRLVLIASPAKLSQAIDSFSKLAHLPASVIHHMNDLIHHRFGRSVDSFDIKNLAASLPMPGLVIHDRLDDVIPFSEAEAIVSLWPQASLLPTEGLGHRRILRDPQVIRHVVDFLALEKVETIDNG